MQTRSVFSGSAPDVVSPMILSGLARGISTSWVRLAVQATITFLLTPAIIGGLGPAEYGVWILLVSLTGYYGLLDLGFSASLTQYIARYRAENNLRAVNEIASTGLIILAGCALALLVVTALISVVIPDLIDIPSGDSRETRATVLLLGAVIAMQFVFFPFSAIFPATQNFVLANAIGVATRVVYGILAYMAVAHGGSLMQLALVHFVVNVVDYLLRLLFAYRILPGLKISAGHFRRERLREIMSYGVWNVIIKSGVRIIHYTDVLVIGTTIGPAAVTPYALAGSICEYLMRVFVPIGQVFFPFLTERDAMDDKAGIARLFVNGSRFASVLAFTGAVCAFLLGRPFLDLWIGAASRPAEYASSADVLLLLAASTGVSASQRVAHQIFLATRRMKSIARLVAFEAILNLLLSLLLVQHFGLLGVAAGTLLPALGVNGWLIPYMICNRYELAFRAYLWSVIGPSVLVAVLTGLGVLWIIDFLPPTRWGLLVIDTLAAGALATFLICVIALRKDERRSALAVLRREQAVTHE